MSLMADRRISRAVCGNAFRPGKIFGFQDQLVDFVSHMSALAGGIRAVFAAALAAVLAVLVRCGVAT